MIELDQIRTIAMALPHVEERPSVKGARRIAGLSVYGKGFLGVETGGKSTTISMPVKEAEAIQAKSPKAFEEIWCNGKTFMGLRVDLTAVSSDQVRSLIEQSWRHTAEARKPKR